MIKRIAGIALLLFSGLTANADDGNVCPCIPVSKVWVVTSCETWNCAQAAMVLANGDPYVMAIPTSDSKYGWVIVRRVVAGSAITSIPDPFQISSYASIHDALSRYMIADPNTFPMMATTIDGATLVLHLHEAAPPGRRRAAGH